MERETDQELRDRQETARTDAIRERQIRLGHISDPAEEPPPSEIPEGEPPQPQYTGGEIPREQTN